LFVLAGLTALAVFTSCGGEKRESPGETPSSASSGSGTVSADNGTESDLTPAAGAAAAEFTRLIKDYKDVLTKAAELVKKADAASLQEVVKLQQRAEKLQRDIESISGNLTPEQAQEFANALQESTAAFAAGAAQKLQDIEIPDASDIKLPELPSF
jgi:TolA-binding protein